MTEPTNTAHAGDYRTAPPFKLPAPAWVDRRCNFCGSASPEVVLEMLEAGAHVELADQKYGWPHKWYVTPATGNPVKFYSAHLKDADDDQRASLERAFGMNFVFDDKGGVHWRPLPPAAIEEKPPA